MIRCLHCGAETSNGLALCELCQRFVVTALEYLPVYFRNLARWRPGRAGSRPVPGSRVLYDGVIRGAGTGDRISDALDEVATALLTWARVLVKDRPHFTRPLTYDDAVLTSDLPSEVSDVLSDDPPQMARVLCRQFEKHLTSIATLDWCGEFVRDLGIHETRLRQLTENAMPGWYAGGCRRCAAPTYVVPGLTWVTCGSCGATTYARDHLDVILTEARGWVARPMRLAEAVVALVDTEMSVPRLHKRISKWGERERIEALRRLDHDGDPTGPKRFRFGDVLDVLRAEGSTRLDDKGERNAAHAS
jgi:hypothetical protein